MPRSTERDPLVSAMVSACVADTSLMLAGFALRSHSLVQFAAGFSCTLVFCLPLFFLCRRLAKEA